MNEVCRFCPNNCIDAEPVTVEGESITNSVDIIGCYRYTCGMTGRLAARHVLKTGEPEALLLDSGQIVDAIPFGSDDKPTGDGGEFQRYVTLDGDVIANNANGQFFKTGQNVYKRNM